jgi:hypothetical protein
MTTIRQSKAKVEPSGLVDIAEGAIQFNQTY